MKPTGKQISDLQKRISRARTKRNLSYADLAKMANVHASQVSRICAGDFKTISNNVVQICKILKVKVPRLEEENDMDTEWAKAHASLRRIWDETPEGAATIRRVLDAIADLRTSRPTNDA
ncbi:helix-turn-helix domain-containing protein [Oricola indica]|jgi:ribosome-binding protein aMBF1 (putative translation factor)|uniref:helix-turn-helix domain-containing protein n=1 Tax=Oricola indica TaxID=2872591 RepID=UPI001CBA9767|nr:helix-turn-helix transcriptional regulator [Oricola indica]